MPGNNAFDSHERIGTLFHRSQEYLTDAGIELLRRRRLPARVERSRAKRRRCSPKCYEREPDATVKSHFLLQVYCWNTFIKGLRESFEHRDDRQRIAPYHRRCREYRTIRLLFEQQLRVITEKVAPEKPIVLARDFLV